MVELAGIEVVEWTHMEELHSEKVRNRRDKKVKFLLTGIVGSLDSREKILPSGIYLGLLERDISKKFTINPIHPATSELFFLQKICNKLLYFLET